MSKTIELTARDGHVLSAYKAEPGGRARGAVIVVQEIFGVNSHIRQVADGYAADGYVAIAPAFFDRLQRGYETGYTPADIDAGRTLMGRLAWETTVKDLDAAVEHGRASGKVGLVGYCWGGTVGWRAAAQSHSGLAAVVAYYGGGIPNFLDEAPVAPIQLHFGELDQHPSAEQARTLMARYPKLAAWIYPGANHGFNCDQRGSYHRETAQLARGRALEFLRTHVG
jgi:carboxymethylenebutenolidase